MIEATNTMNFVMSVLAVGSVLGPVIFGFVLWKMSQVFVTQERFSVLEKKIELERSETNVRLKEIDAKLVELLQRTAERRNHD